MKTLLTVALVIGCALLAGWLAPADAAQRPHTCTDVCGMNYVAVPVFAKLTGVRAHRPR